MFRLSSGLFFSPCLESACSSAYSSSASRFKTGIVMINMGGPETANDVPNFLLRLFSDKEIFDMPAQSLLARWVAKRRSPKVIRQYNEIGGGSPLMHWTKQQGAHMIRYLDELSPHTGRSTICNDGVERVVAFSQYPQFSCTTSGSSFNTIARHYLAGENGGSFTGVERIQSPPMKNGVPTAIWSFIDRWPAATPLVAAFAQLIKQQLDAIEDPVERANTVLLFSAHSIPISVVDRGDPYPQEVAATVHAVMSLLNFAWPYRLVWQSKVGPVAWLGPSTKSALSGLARLGYRHAMLIPIAFTSDHIETLHEMDIQYCTELANKVGMVRVHRAPALNDNEIFIKGLADIVAKHLKVGESCTKQFWLRCPMCTNPGCATTRKFLSDGAERLSQWTLENSADVERIRERKK
ncbi:unnamed protein product [Calicophoron daubneyi]|uniref:Ferrochelatase n=1 Tax=Calicophoron daubneyi TaxID=300641 RepID=A0AAV2T0R9_CALDB